MWLFTNNAFLSVVEKRGDSDTLLVRARMDGDIEKFFGSSMRMEEVFCDQSCDYPYRLEVNRKRFADLVQQKIMTEIHYPDFKGSIKDTHRYKAYSSVWGVMLNEFQKIKSVYKW